MIRHKVSIVLARESIETESCSFEGNPKQKTGISNQWQISILGDVEYDDPIQANNLLGELQTQINIIRSAYH
jgi:hypothetical protein